MAHNHIDQPGLRARMGREGTRISSQHRQLDSLYEMIISSAERGSPEEAKGAFVRFSDAFDAHISLEDSFYFPAIRGMHPGVESDLDTLVADHVAFRVEVERLLPLFEEGAGAWREPLESFVDKLAEHELREEALLKKIAPAEPD